MCFFFLSRRFEGSLSPLRRSSYGGYLFCSILSCYFLVDNLDVCIGMGRVGSGDDTL
jgi:hypothetical protein